MSDIELSWKEELDLDNSKYEQLCITCKPINLENHNAKLKEVIIK